MTFEPITTQAEFERRLKDRLYRQCEVHRLELEEFRDRTQAELDELTEALRLTRAKLAAAEARTSPNPDRKIHTDD